VYIILLTLLLYYIQEDPAKLNGYFSTEGWSVEKEYVEEKDKKKKKKKKKKDLKTEDDKNRQESVATVEGDLDGIKLISMNNRNNRKNPIDSDDELEFDDNGEERRPLPAERDKDSDDEDEFLEDLLFGDSECA